MKKLLVSIIILSLAGLSAEAQVPYGQPYGGYRDHNSDSRQYRHYNQNPNPYSDRGRGHDRGYGYNDRGGRGFGAGWYGGIKFGMTASSVSSESSALNGNRIKTGISIGAVAGVTLAPMMFFETGLGYVEKGGSSKNNGSKFSYELNYLELPLILKYCCYTPSQVVIQPFVGCYLGLGISGDIKDYQEREAFSSYSDGYFRHGDCGLKFGCGFTYSFIYAGIGYDLGLSNIGQDQFDETRNRALRIDIGFSF